MYMHIHLHNIVMRYYASINNTIATKLHVHVILGISCVCMYMFVCINSAMIIYELSFKPFKC